MAKKENVTITPEGLRLLTIMDYSSLSEINGFYQNEVFFSSDFAGEDSNLFQALGNLGAFARRTNLDKDISIVVVSNKILKDFDEGKKHPFISEIEDKLNQNNSPYRRIKFISEDHLIWYLENRINITDDGVTRDLVKKYKESKKYKVSDNLFDF